jgi:mRNA-degrading endonuclease RelE of RelBE toxin-antitoxin system
MHNIKAIAARLVLMGFEVKSLTESEDQKDGEIVLSDTYAVQVGDDYVCLYKFDSVKETVDYKISQYDLSLFYQYVLLYKDKICKNM